ncbi:MAG: M23 family metallopeptidase [Bacteroidales bacterium]|jgi:murein DD-endopeptidase MepM/ murein hydrolase activator NlpD|nr:M23 family metallopeptidase [Bacteroidales bacterium]
MKKQPNQKKRIEKLRDKYRLIIYNDESFEEVFSYRLNRLNVFFLVGFSSLVLVAFVYLLIAYTPLKEYVIPNYPKLEERQKILETAIQTDSLEYKLKVQEQYLSALQDILRGETPPQYVYEPDSVTAIQQDISFERSVYDSILRHEVQKYEDLNISENPGVFVSTNIFSKKFIAPITGIISQCFSQSQHWAIDIVAEKNEVIRSVLDGSIIIQSWSLETGYIVGVQHENNFISFYKHNSKLLKKTGDRVKAGEGIAIIGNTGEITSGPHLHFELWKNGVPVNPEEYISF